MWFKGVANIVKESVSEFHQALNDLTDSEYSDADLVEGEQTLREQTLRDQELGEQKAGGLKDGGQEGQDSLERNDDSSLGAGNEKGRTPGLIVETPGVISEVVQAHDPDLNSSPNRPNEFGGLSLNGVSPSGVSPIVVSPSPNGPNGLIGASPNGPNGTNGPNGVNGSGRTTGPLSSGRRQKLRGTLTEIESADKILDNVSPPNRGISLGDSVAAALNVLKLSNSSHTIALAPDAGIVLRTDDQSPQDPNSVSPQGGTEDLQDDLSDDLHQDPSQAPGAPGASGAPGAPGGPPGAASPLVDGRQAGLIGNGDGELINEADTQGSVTTITELQTYIASLEDRIAKLQEEKTWLHRQHRHEKRALLERINALTSELQGGEAANKFDPRPSNTGMPSNPMSNPMSISSDSPASHLAEGEGLRSFTDHPSRLPSSSALSNLQEENRLLKLSIQKLLLKYCPPPSRKAEEAEDAEEAEGAKAVEDANEVQDVAKAEQHPPFVPLDVD